MTSRKFLSFLVALGCFSLPTVWAGTYKAHCPGRPTCLVTIKGDRLTVDNKVVPVQALSIWAKSGPGVQTNTALGAVGSILLGVPGLLLFYGIQSFQSVFSISYFMPSGEIGQLSFGFKNVDESRFFETELLTILGLPMGKERPEAKGFIWKESDYSVNP